MAPPAHHPHRQRDLSAQGKEVKLHQFWGEETETDETKMCQHHPEGRINGRGALSRGIIPK